MFGYEIFKYYTEDGDRNFIDSGDINEYLQEITGKNFTAKDFRTWAGTLLAAIELEELGEFDSAKQAKQNVSQAVKKVAQQLGNRPATCRKYYIHPAIIEAYQEGILRKLMSQTSISKSANNELNPEEKVVLKIIKKYAFFSF